MARQASELFDEFHRRLLKLDRTKQKMESLFQKKLLTKFDIEQVYAGLYLDVFVSFERYLETLFVNLVTEKVTTTTPTKTRLNIQSTTLALDIMHMGKSYLDWLPYKYTHERAEHFFKKGLPFTKVTKQQNKTLEEMHRIRNALAHRSPHSIDVFKRLVANQYPVRPNEKLPSSFLRSSLYANPPTSRFDNYLVEIGEIAKSLHK